MSLPIMIIMKIYLFMCEGPFFKNKENREISDETVLKIAC